MSIDATATALITSLLTAIPHEAYQVAVAESDGSVKRFALTETATSEELVERLRIPGSMGLKPYAVMWRMRDAEVGPAVTDQRYAVGIQSTTRWYQLFNGARHLLREGPVDAEFDPALQNALFLDLAPLADQARR